jgi:hypothetical protein
MEYLLTYSSNQINTDYMKKMTILLTACILSACTSNVTEPISSEHRILLPDGTSFPFWDDQTVYKKVYYVDQNNPKASDRNQGSEESPFKTINQAAKVLLPGEKVVVKKGIYRENIRPVKGGNDKKSMICYEAASGDEVVISGSEVLKENWIRSKTPYKPSMVFSHKLWMAAVPQSYFKEPSPFRIQNLDEYELKVMSWANDWKNRVPYTLLRGLVFQDGKRMTQLCAYEDIAKLQGSYWVDTTQNENHLFTLHIHPYDGKDPNQQQFEITTRQSPFNPKVKGINYIRVNGFVFEQVGNGFQVSAKGAFSTYGGSHWIIENNIFRKINSVAVEIGAVTDRHFDNEDSEDYFKTVSGRHIVRKNTIYDCGTGGIQGLINKESLVEDNHIYNIGWQEAEFYYETAAIKLHMTQDCLVRRNHIHDIEAAMGIWLDSDNINSRVTQNLIYNVSCNFGGIFMEISFRPNLVDNNLVWNCGKNGIYQHDADSLYIVNNIVGHSKENGIMMKTNPGRKKDNGEYTTARYNKVLNNILIDNPVPFSYSDTINISDNNIISSSYNNTNFDWKAWNRKGFDKYSKFINLFASFNSSDLVFHLKINEPLPQVARLPYIDEDLIGRKYNSKLITPGAFLNSKNEVYKLKDYFLN